MNNIREVIEVRLEIIRSVRETMFKILDNNIKMCEDEGVDTTLLKAKRKVYRDCTEPYKELLALDVITYDPNNVLMANDWDAFAVVNWN